MATFNFFNCFKEDLPEKVHNLGSDTLKMMLTNSAPVATNTVPSDIAEISAGFGYTAGGLTLTVSSSSQTSGTYRLKLSNPTGWTAAGGSIGPFRYWVIYNDTATKLIGWADYGSSITALNTEQILPTFDATNGLFSLA
jgi:hypothetical protein